MSTKARRSGEGAPPIGIALPDDVLVTADLEGREGAFDDLASRHRRAALRAAAGIIGPDQAEDVVQDALLLAHRTLRSLKDRTKFSRWLIAITRWRALRVRQNERRHSFGRVPFETILATLSDLASAPRRDDGGNERLVAALKDIPPTYAEVLRYHFLHALSHRKIAALLGVPLSTVKWRCHRGKELLRCNVSPEPLCPTKCRKGCPRFEGRKNTAAAAPNSILRPPAGAPRTPRP